MQLSRERIGCFTASRISELVIGVRGGTATRDKYIRQKAVEKATGIANRGVKTYAMEHGSFNEYEALEAFQNVSGLNVLIGKQEYFKIDENSGATPDGFVVDFNDVITATIDAKSPQPDGFYEQKMLLIDEGKPEYQNVPKSYFYQAQVQMMAATVHNATLGLSPVNEHYLVRYLAEYFEDENGDLIQVELPVEERIFWSHIKADKKYQDEISEMIRTASAERDLLIQIFKQPIINTK